MSTRLRRCAGAATVLFALVALTALVFALSEHDGSAWTLVEGTEPPPFTADYYASPDMRFGVAFAKGLRIPDNGGTRLAQIMDYAVGLLHAGWYSDWTVSPRPPRPNGIQYAQLILVRESAYPTNTLVITETVASNPGALWIIGNEPEGKYGQGNRTPEQYAEIYHDMHRLIKSLDPTAQVAIGGVILPTPLRLEWLDEVLRNYETRYGQEMPVDVWNIHVQILQEKADDWGAEIPAGLEATEGELFDFSLETGFYDNANPQIFKRLVTDFRQWMKDKGLQDKPLIISEYGVLFPSTYIGYGEGYGDEDFGNRVLLDFMYQTFDFLVNTKDPALGYPQDENRLVQQWMWYSLNDRPYDFDTGEGYNGGLFSHLDPNEMTMFGAAFRYYVHTLLGLPKVLLPSMIKPGAPG